MIVTFPSHLHAVTGSLSLLVVFVSNYGSWVMFSGVCGLATMEEEKSGGREWKREG